jgi:integrase
MARRKLLPQTLRKLEWSEGRWTEYYDTVQPGLELRISPKGFRSWAVRCRLRGRQIRVSLGAVEGPKPLKLSDARERARDVQRQAGRGEDPRRPRAGDRLTVHGLGLDALKTLVLRPATRAEWERLLEVEIKPALGAIPADELERADIRRWAAEIVKRGSPGTARHAFAALRRFFSWGVSNDIVRATPFVGLEAPAPAAASNRVLTTEELRAVWSALALMDQLAEYTGQERAFVDATRLLILTAARREMVIGMRRAEFEALKDPAAARWIVPASRMKGGRDHVVPLASQALAVISKRLKAETGEALFPAGRGASGPVAWSSRFTEDLRDLADGELRRARGVAARNYRAKHRKGHGWSKRPNAPALIAPWTIHNLRHTVATHMAEDLGVPTDVISLVLAHRPPGAPVSMVYNRAERLAERRDALTRWAVWVERLLA